MRAIIRNTIGKMVGRLGGLPLQIKLIVAYIGVILIPVVLFSIYTFQQLYDNTLLEIKRKNEFALDSELKDILNNMEIMERTAQLAVSDRAVLNYLTSSRELAAEELVNFNMNVFPNLQHLLYSNPNLSNIRLFTDNPHVNEIWPIIFREERIYNRHWLPRVSARNGMTWWEMYSGPEDILRNGEVDIQEQTAYISLLREIQGREGAQRGVVQIDMKLEQFSPKTFGSLQDRESQMVIFSRDAQPYYRTDRRQPGSLPTTVIREQLLMHAEGKQGSFRFAYHGMAYLGLYRYIDGPDAYLMNVVSLEPALSDIRGRRNQLLSIVVVLIAFLSLISYGLHALILRQLTTLRDSMKQVHEGNFEIRIPVYGQGEIAELARHFRKMLGKIKELIAEAVHKQAAAKEAELNSLKNQIDSHFLYNTLENLKMMAEVEGHYPLSDALTSLGSMMRYSFQWSADSVSLEDEIRHIRNYMALMNIRYDDRLRLEVQVPDELHARSVLKMTLQPIVENAVKHGWKPERAEGEAFAVKIQAFEHRGSLHILITDNGAGMPEWKMNEVNAALKLGDKELQQQILAGQRSQNHGIGLRNVQTRIRIHCGEGFGIHVDSRQGSSTTVHMVLPQAISAKGGNQDEKSIDCG
ncbi:sensor histidine kinase [Paenibacillus sp. P96]|uniref:Sensor histidine kinase n=1 Tax=Paenibacillus zeirhizosphaerae TaxID=2987519 RepID=A0ABT9FRV2_9BACL|nr:sensor histidine kinase [Paenibacillus sp. P96]MDP4097340.1 sensor histidine kinase [Paenibacillus sp. P96]